MVAAIKQHVTVDPDGNIVLRGTALPPGTKAEVIVLVDDAPAAVAPQPDSFLAALDALQKSMNLDRATAERWAAEARTLREWNRPRE
jgi:hypothetical protein